MATDRNENSDLIYPSRGGSKRLLSGPEVAEYLGVSSSTVRSWVLRGLLPGCLEGTRKWDRRAIDAALDRKAGLASVNSNSGYDTWKANRNASAP